MRNFRPYAPYVLEECERVPIIQDEIKVAVDRDVESQDARGRRYDWNTYVK